MLLLALGSLLCAFALMVVVEALLRPSVERRASLRRVVSYATVQEVAPRALEVQRPSLLEAVVPAFSRIALRLTPKVQPEDFEMRLAAAGVRRLNAQQFLALKTALGLLGIVLGFALGGLDVGGFALVLLLLAASLFLPDVALSRRARLRAERLTAHLAQTIDQIAISLEAGLGFDAAVSHFVRRARSPLAGELRILLTEIRMGEPRVNALKRLAERVPSDDMRNFVQTLIQSEGVGLSRASLLRTQAADLRNRRQLLAEERAQKAPIKMLFPTVIFILPVMFIVILGPAFQQASQIFGS